MGSSWPVPLGPVPEQLWQHGHRGIGSLCNPVPGSSDVTIAPRRSGRGSEVKPRPPLLCLLLLLRAGLPVRGIGQLLVALSHRTVSVHACLAWTPRPLSVGHRRHGPGSTHCLQSSCSVPQRRSTKVRRCHIFIHGAAQTRVSSSLLCRPGPVVTSAGPLVIALSHPGMGFHARVVHGRCGSLTSIRSTGAIVRSVGRRHLARTPQTHNPDKAHGGANDVYQSVDNIAEILPGLVNLLLHSTTRAARPNTAAAQASSIMSFSRRAFRPNSA